MGPSINPRAFRLVMNWWPPFRGAGIRVREIAPDWSRARVELRAGLFNRNFVGTHFGGSLFMMTDPFYMLMLLHALGRDYLVWDQYAAIEYLRPGRGTVTAEFALDAARLKQLRRDAADGSKLLPEFEVEIRDASGVAIARVHKRLYVRLKARARGGASPT